MPLFSLIGEQIRDGAGSATCLFKASASFWSSYQAQPLIVSGHRRWYSCVVLFRTPSIEMNFLRHPELLKLFKRVCYVQCICSMSCLYPSRVLRPQMTTVRTRLLPKRGSASAGWQSHLIQIAAPVASYGDGPSLMAIFLNHINPYPLVN